MSSSSRTQATSPLGNPLPLHRPSTGTGTSASGLRTDMEAGRSEQSGLLEKEGMQGSTQPSRPLEPQKRLWYRLRGKDRKWVTWSESLKAIAFSSFLNAFLIFLPFAWAAHFAKGWQGNHGAVFALCFLTIMPLERLFDWGGEQLAMYLGDDLGDLVVITLNNAVEATLAIILLRRCELKLLQSTIVGVILLHLLLIPGTGFLVGGARIMHQHLNPHESGLNQTLLIIGVMSLVIPTAFFQSLNRSAEVSAAVPNTQVISDEFRHRFLQMARGSSVILLIVYIGTRIYLHNPPGEGNALKPTPDAPREEIEKDAELEEAQPRVNAWACLILLVISVSLMAVTAEFLVESIEFVREESSIEEEWFGLFLLPLVSFSADGAVSIVYFVRSQLRGVLGDPPPIETLAEDKAIDLSVQFALFWTPFVVLLGWWSDRPMSMLFDLFEVTCLVAACFMVNYVTADSKTNWAEGLILIAFYAMIALSAWFYTGQPEIRVMSVCLESVAVALERGVGAEE